jgi:hypothetical protein
MRTFEAAMATSILAVLLAGCARTSAPESARATDYCSEKPIRTDALDAPEKHAWDLFLSLNHPAKPIQTARGEPDCTKPLGAPGTTSVWETWRLARTEVFLPDGSEPPEWSDTSIPGALFGKTPDQLPSLHTAPSMKPRSKNRGFGLLFDPEKDQGVFDGHGGIGETHMNKATYDLIKEQCLWSFDGLSRYSKAVLDGKKPPLNFTADSVEVKAVWVKFSSQDVQSGRSKSYYTATVDGTTYGLTSFHILTKDTPNWFWTTFHHKTAPKNPDETPSTYPQPKKVAGTVWENYVLGGTQTDFTTATGEPTVLSDYYIEFEFTKSSCITCHAASHGHPEPQRDANGKLSRTPNGGIAAARQGPLQTDKPGLPPAEKFKLNGKPYFMQTDFLWSIPFRAQEEQKPPPDRCKF